MVMEMKKAEAETAIRWLCHEWRKVKGYSGIPTDDLSFIDFMSWLEDHYPRYLTFRSRVSNDYLVELWFDQEFKRMWSR